VLSLITPFTSTSGQLGQAKGNLKHRFPIRRPDRDSMGYFDQLGQTPPPNTLNTPNTVTHLSPHHFGQQCMQQSIKAILQSTVAIQARVRCTLH